MFYKENTLGKPFPRQYPSVFIAVIIVVTGSIGGAIPFYIGKVGDHTALLMVLPALIMLAFLFMFSRILLLVLILLFRASGDLLLAATKLNFGEMNIGFGALINAFMLLIALLLVVEKPGIFPKKMFSMWSFFLLAGLYGVLIAPSKSDAIRMYLGTLSNFSVFIGSFYLIRSREGFGICARLVLWSSAVPVGYALFDLFVNGSLGGLAGFRLKSTFSHPNIFAFYLTLVISLALYILKNDMAASLPPVKRTALMIYMFVLLVLLLLTQTRSAWIACFALFFLYGFWFERRYLVYLILAPFLALLIPSVQERLLDLGTGNEYVQYAKLNSFAWRRLMWETGLKWMQAGRYLLGYGGESFSYYSPVFFPLSGGSHMGAHSVYVQLFFELGLVGLSAFLWLFIRGALYLRSLFLDDRLAGLTAVVLIIEYLMVSISDNVLHYLVFNWYFWFIIGAALATATFHREAESAQRGLAGIDGQRANVFSTGARQC